VGKKNKKWDIVRYLELQHARKHNVLTVEECLELEEMALERLFAIIESDPDVKQVFKRLKDR
jgi:hypothetical protein